MLTKLVAFVLQDAASTHCLRTDNCRNEILAVSCQANPVLLYTACLLRATLVRPGPSPCWLSISCVSKEDTVPKVSPAVQNQNQTQRAEGSAALIDLTRRAEACNASTRT